MARVSRVVSVFSAIQAPRQMDDFRGLRELLWSDYWWELPQIFAFLFSSSPPFEIFFASSLYSGHSASFHWHTSRWQYLVPLANLPSGDLLGIQWDPVNTVSLEKDVVYAISLSPAENCYALNQSWSQGGRLKQIRTFKFSATNEFVFVFTFSMVPITLLCVL